MDRIIKVGIAELRSKLATYLTSNEPIAVVRRGQTIGYFVPAVVSEDILEKEALEQATAKLNELLQQRSLK